MGHIALYREWRPRTFDEIVEQSHTVAALKQAVISGKIAHAYLFSGTRGTGKTTMAQVFSRAINCLAPVNGNPCNQCSVCTGILNGSILDVIEMDAASNNSVDTIRRLCDEIIFTPSITKYKVYIIDEVHMLSTGAFNALLKTLEEPPSHAVFILATTEQHRIPATILSRCQRYEFRRIPIVSIVERLRKIADSDGVAIKEDALKTIAQLADGALRDAISLLDQAKGSFQHTIEKEDILSLVGVVNDDFMNHMALAIVNHDPALAMKLVEEFILDGRDVIRFTMDLATYFRNVMICHVTKNPEDLVYAPAKTISGMKEIAASMSLEAVLELIRDLSALVSDLRWSLNTRITFEIAIIRFMDSPEIKSNAKVEMKSAVKDEVKSNDSVSKAVSPVVSPISTPVVSPISAPVASPISTPVPTHAPAEAPASPFYINPIETTKESSIILKAEKPISPQGENNKGDFESITISNSSPVENIENKSETEPARNVSTEHVEALFSDEEVSDFLSLTREDGNYIGFPPADLSDQPFDAKANSGIEDFSFAKDTTSTLENKKSTTIEFQTATENPVIDKIPEASPVIETNEAPTIDVAKVWPVILDNIISSGQMTVYLFLLPAKPVFKENVFHILFEDKDRLNYNELSTKHNHQIISQAVLSSTGLSLEVVLGLKSEELVKNSIDVNKSVQTELKNDKIETTSGDSNISSIESLKKSAEELGISFYMEE